MRTSILIAAALFGISFPARPLPAQPQEKGETKEIPKITWEDQGSFRILAKELQARTAGRIHLGDGLEPKEIKVSVRDAGFFEALDALCRAHKEATYFPRKEVEGSLDHFTIWPQPWVEYPSTYTGHYKIALASMMRTVRSAPDGEGARVSVQVVLFGPPWNPWSGLSATPVEWKVETARDSADRDVLESKDEDRAEEERTELDLEMNWDMGSYLRHPIDLLDFDLSKGLKTLSGHAKLNLAESRVVRLTAEAGSTLEIPQGTLTVDGVTEREKSGDASEWTVGISFKSKDGSPSLQEVLEAKSSHDGAGGQWRPLEFPWKATSFEIKAWPPAKAAPKWIELKVLSPGRVLEIPFRFKDVAF